MTPRMRIALGILLGFTLLPVWAQTHTVAPGETLFSLARRYGTTVEELMRLNGLSTPLIRVGQVLKLPAPAQEGPPPEPAPQAPAPPQDDWDPHSPLVQAVLPYLGVVYRYGADAPSGLDCSAFVARVYADLGVSLPRTSREQWAALPPVELADLRPGDLVFFSFGGREVDHVGIYLGRSLLAHANSYGGRVVVESLEAPHLRKTLRGARRPPAPAALGRGMTGAQEGGHP